MTQPRPWFEKRLPARLSAADLPAIVERLRGTPARVEERLRLLAPEILTRRPDGKWSIQEHVGHLLDLEEPWIARLDEMLGGARRLSVPDLRNRKTQEAGHNAREIAALLNEFREARRASVTRLEGLAEEQLACESIHPLLREPMNVVGLCYFVAEHDDHHLSTIEGRL